MPSKSLHFEKCSVICFASAGFGYTSTTPSAKLAAGSFQDQLRRTLARPVANAHVRAALETITGFAAQSELLARAADVRWLEIRTLDEHVFRVVVDFRIRAAHHAGERDAFLFVGDQEHFVRQRAFLIVERLEFFARSGAAHDDGRD